MAAIDTLRDALFGDPPSVAFKPSRDDVITAFEELIAELTAVDSNAATLAELAATPISVDSVFLTEAGKEGIWVRALSSANTALLSADTLYGVSIISSVNIGHCWLRVWDKVNAKPEWFGAAIGNAAVDSYPAMQACLDVTGILVMGRGAYYGSRGLLLPDNAVVRGQGALVSGYVCTHATDHLMRQRGVSGVSYAFGADLRDFALERSVNPTTPASSADDITQGHGLHFFMVSNPRVRSVYTYNNLAELYYNNVLSPHFEDVRGIRNTGGGSDRWYGVNHDGVTGGGTFGGPSPNPSATLIKPNMVGRAAVGTNYNYYLRGALQDLWVVDPEAAGQAATTGIQFFLDINGATAGDVHIIRPIADGYKTNGIYVDGAPLGSSIDIVGAWIAPNAAATSTGVVIDASHGVNLSGRADFAAATGLACVSANDCTELDCDFRSANSQTPFSGTSVSASRIKIKAYKSAAGGGGSFGNIVTLIGGSRNRVEVSGTISAAGSPQLWVSGIALDGTAAGCTLDVTGMAVGAATDRVAISGTGVTTQGNVSGHVIINPGAGAML